VASAGGSNSLVLDPAGKYLYVTNTSTGTLAQYSVGSSGVLTPLVPADVDAGGGQSGPVSIAVDPFGKYVYVANSGLNSIGQFSLGSGGALSALTTPTVAAGTGPGFLISVR
jgi:DNA-binding beta-propeller fold protein YncE